MSQISITVKDLSQWKITLSIDTSDKVEKLKETLKVEKGLDDYSIKLIFKGTQLLDDETIEHYKIAEGDVIIMFATKIRKAAAPQPEKKAEVSESKAPAQPTPQTPAAAPEAAPAPAAQTPEFKATVDQLKNMGFTEEQIVPCLRAAFGDADRAVEYLMSGIPANLVDQASGAAPAPAESASAAPTDDAAMDVDEPSAAPAELPADLASLQHNPEFIRMVHAIQQNPAMLEYLLIELGKMSPDTLKSINENQEAFLRMINETNTGAVGGAGGRDLPPGAVQIQVTREEKAAIDRLIGLGFNEQMAMEAYFACDKNEELAANYLFDSME